MLYVLCKIHFWIILFFPPFSTESAVVPAATVIDSTAFSSLCVCFISFFITLNIFSFIRWRPFTPSSPAPPTGDGLTLKVISRLRKRCFCDSLPYFNFSPGFPLSFAFRCLLHKIERRILASVTSYLVMTLLYLMSYV